MERTAPAFAYYAVEVRIGVTSVPSERQIVKLRIRLLSENTIEGPKMKPADVAAFRADENEKEPR